MVASGTPCESSSTVSRSGHLVAATRRRSSTSSSSGTLTRKGRMVASSAAAPGAAGLGLAVVLSVIPVPPHRCRYDRSTPVGRPEPLLHCCADTVPAARPVSLAPAGIRIRQWPARLASRGLAALRPALRAARSPPPPLGSAGAPRPDGHHDPLQLRPGQHHGQGHSRGTRPRSAAVLDGQDVALIDASGQLADQPELLAKLS